MAGDEKSLIISGFDWSVPESELRRLVEQVGEISSLKFTKQPDGSAAVMVTMSNVSQAEDVILKFDGTHYRGNVIKVRRLEP